jgi:tryptophan synthase alpha chain
MNRLEKKLTAFKDDKALILYLTAGDPDLKSTLEIMASVADNGADCIELGVPFSDPMADGPIIQRSSARALRQGVDLNKILGVIEKFRHDHDTPVVLMGYYNPILHYGERAFFDSLKNAGGDGVILADVPYEEGEPLEKLCNERELCNIYLLAPEMGSERTKKILSASRGFVYCVSHYGTTGVQSSPMDDLKNIIKSLKEMTLLPIEVGFGISSEKKAREICQIADGVIIGSWFLSELENSQDKTQTAAEFARRIKSAISEKE